MIIKCDNGHWYDTSVHRSCPHCKQESEKLSIRLNDIEEDDHTISITEAEISLGEQLGSIIGNTMNSMPMMNSFDMSSGEDDDKTISFGFFGATTLAPVVGWLVCMTGTERGKDFRLHAGKNFVGRGTSMDVVLVDDKTISREKHCSLIYDPKSNQFFAVAEGGNILYVNSEMVNESQPIKTGDLIEIGETKLMFISFCEEGRTWEEE